MKRLLVVLVLFGLTGCATMTDAFNYMFNSDEMRRKDYVEKYMLKPEVEQAILNGEIINGMTKDQVRASWGEPRSTFHQRLVSVGNTYPGREQGVDFWKYGPDGAGLPTEVYFNDGRVCNFDSTVIWDKGEPVQ